MISLIQPASGGFFIGAVQATSLRYSVMHRAAFHLHTASANIAR
nr:MAG TPA: hypothetical protein [Caudoviricetes sp.]